MLPLGYEISKNSDQRFWLAEVEKVSPGLIKLSERNGLIIQRFHQLNKKLGFCFSKKILVDFKYFYFSYDRLRRHLACYESKKPVLLGERYAYALNFRRAGYEYPTGGGGYEIIYSLDLT